MNTRVWAGVLAVVVALTGSALANNLDAVKASMLQRRADVQALLASKVAGENNLGYLEQHGHGPLTATQAAVLSAENGERRQVYASIAAKTGVSIEQVGRQRAATIAAKAPPGTWIQQSDGQWLEKER